MIYFDENKNAYSFEIENYIATIDDETWMEYCTTDKWDIVDGEFVDISGTEAYKEKKAQEERERIGNLKLTKREVFLGLYQAKGVTPDQIKAQITDPMALIEFEYANDYYRGNPLIDTVGLALGIEPAQLDCFFETNDYTCLLPKVEPEEPVEEETNETESNTTDEPTDVSV